MLERPRKCRLDSYERLNLIDEGSYGVVYRARHLEDKKIYAVKEIKPQHQHEEGFPNTSIREIDTLLNLQHDHIVRLIEIVTDDHGTHKDPSRLPKISIIMEYMDHELKALLADMSGSRRSAFSVAEIKCLSLQLLRAVEFLHRNWTMHRDLKTSNILFNNRGVLKICDFGMTRKFGKPYRLYTSVVCTLWYRSPELLLNTELYGPEIDVWSAGCIIAELFLHKPLFEGSSDANQLMKIFEIVGSPTSESLPELKDLKPPKWLLDCLRPKGAKTNKWREIFPISTTHRSVLTASGLEFLKSLLHPSPSLRSSAEDALTSHYFLEAPKPQVQALMPSFAATNSMSHENLKRQAKDWEPTEPQDQLGVGLRVRPESFLEEMRRFDLN